jgi:peptidoglycan hydrolase-like protein with peptidoglycan-binding domain
MKRLFLATSILALATSGAFAQGMNSAPSDTPRSLSPGVGATTGARTTPATPSASASSASAAQTSPDQVIEAQQALKQQGLYKGPVDGKIGPETRSAISHFQKQNGLQQSAQLDERTMNDLQGSNSGAGSSTRMPSNSSMPGSSSGSVSNPSSGTSGTDKDDDGDKN